MAQDKKVTWDRLTELWESPQVESLQLTGARYAVISDLHLGNGGGADDFRKNEEVLVTALKDYYERGFSLILLGDIEELWQFNMKNVFSNYRRIYDIIESFGENRIYRIFGNHDQDWQDQKGKTIKILSRIQKAREAVKLKGEDGSDKIILLHGHQGDKLADKLKWFSKIIVKGYSIIEPLIKIDPRPKSVRTQITKDYEHIFYSWAKQNKAIVICGHSHRAIFASKSRIQKIIDEIADLQSRILADVNNTEFVKSAIKKIAHLQNIILDERMKGRDIDETDDQGDPLPCYFNSGCGIYSDGITTIEITDQTIKLRKWSKTPLLSEKETNYGEEEWGKIFNKMMVV